jgi:legumain
MFFSDHGAPNLIAFPSEYLYADQLLATFNKIKGKFGKFVFYLETCESGSMFVNLPKDNKIYALSAANPTESSWGTYCSPDDIIQGKHIGTCLGDLFSVVFIEDNDNSDLTGYTLQSQFEKVRALTTLSHVMQWGDTSFSSEPVSNFIGRGSGIKNSNNLRKPKYSFKPSTSFDSRLMKIKILA